MMLDPSMHMRRLQHYSERDLAIAVFNTVNAYNDVSSKKGRSKTGESLNNSCKRRVE